MTASPEQVELRDLARAFAQGEIAPDAAAWDEAAELPDAIFDKLAELGFMGMTVPEEYGGLGLEVDTYLMVLEELARADAAVSLTVAIHNGPVAGLLLTHASEEQRRRWLPALASGERLGAFALSEPEAGSDPASMETRATRDGDRWVLSGRKKWVTNGRRADLVLVFAQTDEGVGCFAVERPTEGYEVVARSTTMGLRASETVTVELDDVRVPADALVGDPGRGLAYALDALVIGRAGIAAQAIGIGEAALAHATAYAREREQFGGPIARFDALQAKLADSAVRLAAARALTLEVARELQAGRNATSPSRAAAAKLAASEAAMMATDEAVQIFGGYGYMRHYPVEKLMRDAKGTEIYEGTSEILRVVIARELLRPEG